MARARALNARYDLAYEGFLAASAIYLALVFLVTRGLRRIERAKLRQLARLPD